MKNEEFRERMEEVQEKMENSTFSSETICMFLDAVAATVAGSPAFPLQKDDRGEFLSYLENEMNLRLSRTSQLSRAENERFWLLMATLDLALLEKFRDQA